MNTNAVVLITGASSGIGNVIARTLVDAGFNVYGTSRNPSLDQDFPMVELDVTDDKSVAQCLEYVRQREGRIDVLINNVGSLIFGSAEETTMKETVNEIELNFLGMVRMSRGAIPLMREQGGGKIINISSLAGLVALPFNSASSAGKFALEGYSEALRYELLAFGIYVSLVELSGTQSDGQSRSMQPVQSTMHLYDHHREHAYSQMLSDMQNSTLRKQDVADTVLRIIHENRPRLRYAVGTPSRLVPLLKMILPQSMFERSILSRMGD